ncbi:MAG: dehydrogenase E1 component subunit alpha/beta [Bacteroidota bacterium]|nr:dehydrogenase E1 component subunit alpha/beta [Bacteroidota bacterium]
MADLPLKDSQTGHNPAHETDANGHNGHPRPMASPGLAASGLEVISVGPEDFQASTLLRAYRTMVTARRLDRKMLTLLKQGKGFFHIGCSGHEAAQAALGLWTRPDRDYFCLYYRDLVVALMMGQTVRETLIDFMAKADGPNSGGRQMPMHYSHRDKNMLAMASSVASQFLPALGLGLAIQRRDSNALVLCSAGDGATSQGAFHEALNWSTRCRAPILYLIQDNKYAISVPVSEQTAGGTPYKLAAGYEGLARIQVDGTDFFQVYAAARAATAYIRNGQGPVCMVAEVVRLLPHSSSDNHLKYRSEEELDLDRQVDPIMRMEVALIEGGMLSESSVEAIRDQVHREVDEAAVWAESQVDPGASSATTHVLYEGELDLDYEREDPVGEPVVMVDAINHALHEEMARTPSILVYGEDVAGPKGGVFTATRGLTKAYGEDRCFNSPLAEASIVGTAVGLSAMGFKPVIEIQFADYIWPAMQQLRNQVSSMRYRSNNQWSCPMVIRVPCGGYIHGGICHSQNVESVMAHMPGFRVVMPATAADAKGLLKTSIRCEDPVIFLEHKALYRAAGARTPEPGPEYLVPFGKARRVREGTNLTVVTYGYMVHQCERAARLLAREDEVSLEIIDLRSIMPLDTASVLDSVRKTGRVLIVHEDHEFIGFGAEISAQIADHAFEFLDAPVRRLASALSYVPFADTLERTVLPQIEDILESARQVVRW